MNRMNWSAFSSAEPELAQTVEERFTAFRHHVLATLRNDGSPRTSGMEVRFLDGELWLGMMTDSVKALDLRRDPRFTLQANPGPDTTMGGGDVRIGGRASEVADPGVKKAYLAATKEPDAATKEPDQEPEKGSGKDTTGGEDAKEAKPQEPFHLFRAELTEVVRTYVEDETYLVVQAWRPGQPLRTVKRT